MRTRGKTTHRPYRQLFRLLYFFDDPRHQAPNGGQDGTQMPRSENSTVRLPGRFAALRRAPRKRPNWRLRDQHCRRLGRHTDRPDKLYRNLRVEFSRGIGWHRHRLDQFWGVRFRFEHSRGFRRQADGTNHSSPALVWRKPIIRIWKRSAERRRPIDGIDRLGSVINLGYGRRSGIGSHRSAHQLAHRAVEAF